MKDSPPPFAAFLRNPSVRRAVALTVPSALGAAVAVWTSGLGEDRTLTALGVACGALAGAICASRIGLTPPPPAETPADALGAEEEEPEAAPPPDPLGGGRAALEATPAPLLIIDRRGRISFANAAAKSEMGPALVGQHYTAPLRAPGFFEAVEEALHARPEEGPTPPRNFSFSLHGRQERHLQAFVTPMSGGEEADEGSRENAPRALVLILDQTRARRAEQLHRDFVANASHELKTPLASIAGFIETLQGPAREDEQARDRFLGIMAQQAERMRLLVADLMSLNRIELNEHVPPRDQVDLRAALEDALSIAAAGRARVSADEEAPAGAEALTIDWPASGPVIRGDRAELTQLMANLISNAIKYGGEKRGPLIALLRDPDRPGRVGARVEDYGPGIAREHLPRLTERFYRAEISNGRAVGGTGLGLAIVKHVVARHRGELAIESALGRGSRFTAWLPELDVVGEGRARNAPSGRPAAGSGAAAGSGGASASIARRPARSDESV